MKTLTIAIALTLSTVANAKPLFTSARPSGDIGKVEALKAALTANARPFECVEQELTHKATLKNASGADKTYHLGQPSGNISKGAALKAAFKGTVVYKCSEKVADPNSGTLKNY